MSSSDATQQRAGWWSLRRKTGPNRTQTAANILEGPHSKSSRLPLLNVLTRRKHLPPKASKLSEEESPTPEGTSDSSRGASHTPSLARQGSFRAGPEYVPTVSVSEQESIRTQLTTPPQITTVDDKESKSRPRQFVGIRLARLWKREPVDGLKETRLAIQHTEKIITTKSWAGEVQLKSSSFSMGKLAKACELSPETKQLLEDGAEDFQEFKRKEEEKRMREEEERQRLVKIEEEMEVIDTRLVHNGLTLKRVQRLQPAQSLTTLRTLNPRATKATSMSPTNSRSQSGASSFTSIAGSQATETGLASHASESGRIMERGPGFLRGSRIVSLSRTHKP